MQETVPGEKRQFVLCLTPCIVQNNSYSPQYQAIKPCSSYYTGTLTIPTLTLRGKRRNKSYIVLYLMSIARAHIFSQPLDWLNCSEQITLFFVEDHSIVELWLE